MRTLLHLAWSTATLVSLTGCTNAAPVLPESASFRQGSEDGCLTAQGDYTKNSVAFRQNAEYHEGWFHGRKQCNAT